MNTARVRLCTLLSLLILTSACQGGTFRKQDFVIVSGSENKSLEPVLERFGKEHNVNIVMRYKGSVDIMLDLQDGQIDANAVWPASSIWLSLGDKKRIVKNYKSIFFSPVVFGIRSSKAEALGFKRDDVTVIDVLEAVKNKQLSFAMTSATQSNSGASAYIGFLYALAGRPDVLTTELLQSPELRSGVKQLLAGVSRSSGSSGWLKNLFLKSQYDAMVNYEALIIETNQELLRKGQEPLHVVYPTDGIVLADSPLGYVKSGDENTRSIFDKLQKYLLQKEVQAELRRLGRRTAFGGDYDPSVWKREWGLEPDKVLSPIKLPKGEVIQEALIQYQTILRKPSYVVYALDYSGSMEGNGARQMKSAMRQLFSQESAARFMLQASKEDRALIIPFNNRILYQWPVDFF